MSSLYFSYRWGTEFRSLEHWTLGPWHFPTRQTRRWLAAERKAGRDWRRV